jgi:hypothetical protein
VCSMKRNGLFRRKSHPAWRQAVMRAGWAAVSPRLRLTCL